MSMERFVAGSARMAPTGVVRAAAAAAALGLGALAPVEASGQAASAAAAAAPATERELAPLPEVPSATLADPSPESVEQVARLLERLLGDDDEDRQAAASEVRTVRPDLVAAINRRIDAIAEASERQTMKRLLLDIRSDARNEIRQRMRAEGKTGEVDTPDYFDMVVAHPRLDDEDWQDLVRILALSRMLVAIETVQATRTLIRIYVRFDFLRIDTQLQLDKLGDKALAVLIETRRHEAKKVAEWAERRLDLMGKAIPSEAVQVTDHGVLADVLRAYGRIKDPDAARIIISFANSERAQIREAARQATALMGEVGNWQLRDAYENTVGKRPPRDWDWRRTARELFGEYDRLRLAHVYDLFEKGLAAHRAGQLDEMRAAYDKVLARSPMFEHRAKMAPGYFNYAAAKADDDLESAIAALRRAERLTPDDDELLKRIQSRLMTFEGERLLARGIADQELFRRAVDLDPTNERAKKSFDVAQRGEQAIKDEQQRWVGAVVIGVIALMAILLIVLWPRRRPDESKPELGGDDGDVAEDEELRVEAVPAPRDRASVDGAVGDDEPPAEPADSPPATGGEADEAKIDSGTPEPAPAPHEEAAPLPSRSEVNQTATHASEETRDPAGDEDRNPAGGDENRDPIGDENRDPTDDRTASSKDGDSEF